MVPVGGAMVCGPDAVLIEDIGKTYPGEYAWVVGREAVRESRVGGWMDEWMDGCEPVEEKNPNTLLCVAWSLVLGVDYSVPV